MLTYAVTYFSAQVELFRKLQLLNTDYLRQRVLYSIEDLIMRFLTEESVAREEFKMSGKVCIGALLFGY